MTIKLRTDVDAAGGERSAARPAEGAGSADRSGASAMLRVTGLEKSFSLHNLGKTIPAIRNIEFEVREGEFVGITGKSGSGKSTVLKCLYRTYLPGAGSIWYNSALYGAIDLAAVDERTIIELRKREIGYVSQFLNVMPRTTAKEWVKQAIVETGRAESVAEEETLRILGHFELSEELWDSYPLTFSGGEKLRLNIARAMVKRPRLLLLDEPTASLDDASKIRVRELIEQLMATGTTMIGIFHDLAFMNNLCDREYRMERGSLHLFTNNRHTVN